MKMILRKISMIALKKLIKEIKKHKKLDLQL